MVENVSIAQAAFILYPPPSTSESTKDLVKCKTLEQFSYVRSVFGCHRGDGQHDGGRVDSFSIREGSTCTYVQSMD